MPGMDERLTALMLKQEFLRQQPVSGLPASKTLVNYVWLNRPETKPETNDHTFLGIPHTQLQGALANAEKYPDADFCIWIDFDHLDIKARRYLETDPQPFNLANITLKDLKQIPDFSANPLTRNDVPINVRSDMARLQVLSHCMGTTDHSTLYYSDFDCADIKINDPELREIMDRYNATLGLYSDPDEHIYLSYENGYMGFRKPFGEMFLNEWIIPASQEDMEDTGRGLDTGDTAIIMCFDALERQTGAVRRLGIQVLEPCGYKVQTPANAKAVDEYLNYDLSRS